MSRVTLGLLVAFRTNALHIRAMTFDRLTFLGRIMAVILFPFLKDGFNFALQEFRIFKIFIIIFL